MLAQYQRRHREYTGPSPNSVAIREKPPRRRPAEHLILERRKQESLVEEAQRETTFLEQCDLKSAWVKSTNKRIERNTLQRRVQQELQKDNFLLEDRRERLRELLLDEERRYIEEMEDMQETTLERQAKMRERAKQLKEKREIERQQYVAEKLDQRWRGNCEELRSIHSKRNQDEVCQERNEQLFLKEEGRKRQEEMEQMYANLWESDRQAKCEREEFAAKNQIERNRESLKVLQLQMVANDQKLEEEKKVKELEAEWLKEETRLRKEEGEYGHKEKLRKQEHAKRVRDASVRLKMKKAAKERDEEKALEETIMKKNLEDRKNEAEENEKKRNEKQDENLRYIAYVAQNRQDEKDRGKHLDDLIQSEVEEQWKKKAAKYRLEREARNKLMENVLENRREQIVGKKDKDNQLKLEMEKEKEEIQYVMNEHKKKEQETTERLKQHNKSYQRDLEMQIGYQQKLKAKDKEEEYHEYLQGKDAEMEYQRKLQDALSRPQSEKLHPSRRRTMERYGRSAHS